MRWKKTNQNTQFDAKHYVLLLLYRCIHSVGLGSVWMYWNSHSSNTHIITVVHDIRYTIYKIEYSVSMWPICASHVIIFVTLKKEKKKREEKQTTNEMFLLCVQFRSTWRNETFAFSSILAVCLRSGANIRCGEIHRWKKKINSLNALSKERERKIIYFNEKTTIKSNQNLLLNLRRSTANN